MCADACDCGCGCVYGCEHGPCVHMRVIVCGCVGRCVGVFMGALTPMLLQV